MKQYEWSCGLKALYGSTKRTPELIDVPDMNYLTFCGAGHPSEDDFQLACEALYTLSYMIKFEIARKQMDTDYKVQPMEVTCFLDKSSGKTAFTWTMMIMQPDFVTSEIPEQAKLLSRAKGKSIAGDRVALRKVSFGLCVQCFHRGDYNNMNDTLAKMTSFADENGFDCDRYTHDIYLNDTRKTKVENYKAIMRTRVYKR